MKIRNPRLIRAASWLGTQLAYGIFRTLKFERRNLGPVVSPIPAIPPGPRYAYSIWHEYILLPAVALGHPELAVLISKHTDGQLLSSLMESSGINLVLGSTNRGGIEAVRQLVNGTAGRRHLGVSPDGPRGPRRVLQPGIIYIASRTGMEVVPVGVGYRNPWRLRSWDRFAIPRPGSRVKMLFGEPIAVPAGLRTEGLERYRVIVQAEMERLGTAAENWAETNRLDLPEATSLSPLRIAG